MTHSQAAAVLDRPWRRPGSFTYALARLRGITRPPVTVVEPPALANGIASAYNWTRSR